MIEQVVLVDEAGREIGHMEKLAAHRSGLLHRAFSVFIFNTKGELLLQRRADGKYHSPGLWTNTCCGHPRPGERTVQAAGRRLMEEMGISCALLEVFDFRYDAALEGGMHENELDHVIVGISDRQPVPDPQEASEVRYIDRLSLEEELAEHPERFTVWFPLCYARAWDMAYLATTVV
ncbi:MAG: isopentenyl-diphosphate Delta-isomerase [Flavobacteriales bacterium]|nr:isopentenyl-diphosphate Delta-isomerase [Flavobacteriales bacterium]HPF90929.1 isopentenyl-diphosphate Delta-isomerase [Flavobacteriales bacterium]